MSTEPTQQARVEFDEPISGRELAALTCEASEGSFIFLPKIRLFALGELTHNPRSGVRLWSPSNYFPEQFLAATLYDSVMVEHFYWRLSERTLSPAAEAEAAHAFAVRLQKAYVTAQETGEFPDSAFLREPVYPPLPSW